MHLTGYASDVKYKWYINDDAEGHGDYQIVVEKYYADESEYGLEYDSFKTVQEAEDFINRMNWRECNGKP